MKSLIALASAATLGLFTLALAGSAEANDRRQSGTRDIKRCGTIDDPGSYVLTRDIQAEGDCLVVSANFVTLNLAGHVISGDGSGRAVTNGGNPSRGIAITGGTITGFALAVDFANSSTVAATNLQVIANSGAVGLLECNIVPLIVGRPSGIATGSNSIVEHNQLFDNVGLAIKVGSGSIVADNTIRDTQSATELQEISGICAFSGSRVSGNALTNNDGLAIRAGSGSTLSGNSARNNGAGLRANSGSTVSGNTARSNSGIGIEANCPSNLIGNTATDNGGGNIVTLGDGCNLVDNLAP